MFFPKKDTYAIYLSYATLDSDVVHVGVKLFLLVWRDIFTVFHHFLGFKSEKNTKSIEIIRSR